MASGARKPDPRRANGYRRTQLRRRVAAQGRPCALCGGPIDYSLPPGHPMSYELDEIVPVSRGGDPFDPDNVQPAHRICNERRGNKLMDATKARQVEKPITTTVEWL